MARKIKASKKAVTKNKQKTTKKIEYDPFVELLAKTEMYESVQPSYEFVYSASVDVDCPFELTVNLNIRYVSEQINDPVVQEEVLVSSVSFSAMPSADLEYEYGDRVINSPIEPMFDDDWFKWRFVKWNFPSGSDKIVTVSPDEIIVTACSASGEPGRAVVNKTVDVTADWMTQVSFYFSLPETGDKPSGVAPYSRVFYSSGQGFSADVEVPCEFFDDGYEFTGWNNIVSGDFHGGTVEWLDPDRTILSVNVPQDTSIHVESTWKKKIDTTGWLQKIYFHQNYGEEPDPERQDVYVGFPQQLITNQFEREKYDFVGWSTSRYGEARYANNEMYNASKYTPPIDPEDPDRREVESLHLYAVWQKQAQYLISDDDICVTGYDPFPVVFRDMSRIRSFKNTYWTYDFGDSYVYGCDTHNITMNSSCEMIFGSAASFILPGDSYVYNNATSAFKDNVILPKVESGVMMCPDWDSYHSISSGDKHYTGVTFRAVTSYHQHGSDMIGSGCYPVEPTDDPINDDMKRIWYWPNTKECTGNVRPVEVSGVHELMNEDDCGRNACERENDLKNSVMHIYKGAGIYYSTMQVSSKTGLQSMEVSNETFSVDIPSSKKEVISECFVKVLPTCPCISGFHVYGDPDSSSEHYSRKFEIIPNEYSCDDGIFSIQKSPFNCVVEYTDINGNIKKTKAISGYAPYLKVWASGTIEPRSIPVKGAYIDWGDWFSDYNSGDYVEYGDPISGWPKWTTSAGNTLHIDGSHIYVMPGLYSIGIAPDFNTEWVKKYMPTVKDYEECMDTIMADTASGCCVLVVENPPKINKISTGTVANPNEHPTIITGISADIKAGSYPISRVDWDFGDGTPVLSISTEGYKIAKDTKDVVGNNNSSAVFVDYNTEYSSASPVGIPNITYGTMYGHTNHPEPTLTYNRFDARRYTISHKYVRTSFDDHPNGYVITVSAYAENTNTCVTAYERVLTTSGSKLPDYNITEGDIELVDTRMDEQEKANIVLQSENGSRLYVNRVIDEK